MNRFAMGVLALAIGVGIGANPAARADATSNARAAVTAAYSKQNAAFRRKDFNAVLALHTADFTGVSKSGKVTTKQEMQKQITGMQAGIKSIMPTSTITKFALKGNQALCTVKEHVTLTAAGPQGQNAVFNIDEVSNDTWIKSGKNWLKKRSQTISQTQKMLVNGKEISVPQQ